MPHIYDVILTAQLTLRGQFTADSAFEAAEVAKAELLTTGQLSDVTVERNILLDDED